MRGRPARRYDAFVSYGHAADAALAPVLQSELQRYAKPWYRARAMRVFRDSTDLAAEPDLWASIERALAASTWFVLLASPAAARSPWVDREVRWWLENRSPDRLLLVLTEGELDEVLPPSLEGAGLPEPGWVDARALGRDGTVDPTAPQLREAVVDVAATVRGIPKERLVGEHRRQHRRTLRLAGAAIAGLSVLLVAAVVATVVAYTQRNQAVDQRRLATARLLLPQAEADRRTDPRTGLLLNEAARHLHPDAQTDASLFQTLLTNRYEATLGAEGREGAAETVAFSSDRRTAAVGNFDGSVVLWDVANPGAPYRLGAPLTGFDYTVHSVAFSPDGHTLAAGSDDHTILLWDVTDPGRARRLGTPPHVPTEMVVSIAFSPDGRTLATGGFGGEIILWDVADPTQAHPRAPAFTSPTGPGSLAFSPDGHTLATGGDGRGKDTTRSVILWDVTDPAAPRPGAALPGPAGGVESVAFSPDGHTLATGGFDGAVVRWDVTDPVRPRPQGAPLTGQGGAVDSVAFSPDGSTLAVATGRDGTVTLWALDDPAGPRRRDDLEETGQAGGVNSVAFSPDGATLATAGENSSTILWDLRAPIGPRRLGPPVVSPDGGGFHEVTALSTDGRVLATNGGDAAVALWDTTDPARPRLLGQPVAATVGTVYSVALSPDRRTLAAGTGTSAGSGGATVLWDVSDPARPSRERVLPGHVDSVDSVRFSPDGHTLATTDNVHSDVTMWNVTDPFHPTGLPPLHSESATIPETETFSRDGHVLAVGDSLGAVTLWDVHDPGRPVPRATVPAGASTAFSPDGHVLAGCDGVGAVTLWDVSNPAAPRRLGAPVPGGRGRATSVAFAPDGYVLAAATGNGGVALWDVRDPMAPRALGAPVIGDSESTDASVAFFPGGRTLMTSSGDDHAVVRWDLTDLLTLRDDTLRHACDITRRGLTLAEWNQFVPGTDYEDACAPASR